jgi:hypothetical protein
LKNKKGTGFARAFAVLQPLFPSLKNSNQLGINRESIRFEAPCPLTQERT